MREMKFALGPLAEFPPGSCTILDVDGKSIGVFNRDGELYALRNLCLDKLAPVCRGTLGGMFLPSAQGEWTYAHDGYILRCVAHGWEFDIRTGESVMKVARGRIATYAVTVEDGLVVVAV